MDEYQILSSLCNNCSSNRVGGLASKRGKRSKNVGRKREKGKKEEETDAWTESGSSQVAQWKSSIPASGCEWVGSPLKVARVFALRMRSSDVSLYPAKERGYSLRVCFSSLLHARESHRDYEKYCYCTDVILSWELPSSILKEYILIQDIQEKDKRLSSFSHNQNTNNLRIISDIVFAFSQTKFYIIE